MQVTFNKYQQILAQTLVNAWNKDYDICAGCLHNVINE